MKRPLGFIVYAGPSQIDGAFVVCVATVGSKNAKTGPLVQTWIIRSDISPREASNTRQDSSVCGDCPHRQSMGGACYVRIDNAPRSVYAAYKAGRYVEATPADLATLARRGVRAGSYGDPGAVPLHVWDALRPVTGYTHQWRTLGASGSRRGWQSHLMASCDSLHEREIARAMGWRCFVVLPEGMGKHPFGTITCPATTTDAQCADCGLCDGTKRASARDISLPIHGSLANRFLPVLQA